MTLMMAYDSSMTKTVLLSTTLKKLKFSGKPIARIEALHNNSFAASTKPDDAAGLYPVVFLSVGACVMLTANLWPEVGLCNGAAGTVQHILYQEYKNPPDLPIAALVNFAHFDGPSFLDHHHHCVPIPPITRDSLTSKFPSKSDMQLQFITVEGRHFQKL